MQIFYFTSTGNCLYVAKKIGGTLQSIPQLMRSKQNVFKDDVIGFVFPCYGLGLPPIVREFIINSSFTADYAFGVMTFGNHAGGGLNSLRMAGKSAGLSFDYTAEIKMVDNYLPLFEMSKQIEGQGEKKIEENIIRVCNDLNHKRKGHPSKNIFIRMASIIIGKIIDYIGFYGNADKKIICNEDCDKCGICSQVCPRDNIRIDKYPEFLHKCESCFACIQNCPKNVLHHKSEKSVKRFRNEHISLKELVEANNGN